MDAKSRAYCIEGLTDDEVRVFDLWAMAKFPAGHPIHYIQPPNPLYGAIMSAISMGYG
jgi:hypothetical protein